MAELPLVATMVGDPCGIGPEVCAKALTMDSVWSSGRILLVGSSESVEAAIRQSVLPLTVHAIRDIAEARFRRGEVDVLDINPLRAEAITVGRASAPCGRAVLEWLATVDALATGGVADACVIGPVNSDALMSTGAIASVDDLQPAGTFLLRVGGKLRIVAISEHLPLNNVSSSVSLERILKVLKITDQALRRWGVSVPRLVVAGLNPHAHGEEEREEIAPAVAAARKIGIVVTGPVSPDAVFRQCNEGRYDVVVSMYHDQGQIALKTVPNVGAWTVYLGAPTVRVTMPHGTAFDIAGKGVADPLSMAGAMRAAGRLVSGYGFTD